MIKIRTLKLVIMLEYQNIKMFLQRVTLYIGLKKFFWLKKLKTLFRGYMLLVILNEKKLLERFTKMNRKRHTKKKLELKNESGEKVISYILNGKDTIVGLI